MKASDSRFWISCARIASNRCSVPVKLRLSKRHLPLRHQEAKHRNTTLAAMSEVQYPHHFLTSSNSVKEKKNTTQTTKHVSADTQFLSHSPLPSLLQNNLNVGHTKTFFSCLVTSTGPGIYSRWEICIYQMKE